MGWVMAHQWLTCTETAMGLFSWHVDSLHLSPRICTWIALCRSQICLLSRYPNGWGSAASFPCPSPAGCCWVQLISSAILSAAPVPSAVRIFLQDPSVASLGPFSYQNYSLISVFVNTLTQSGEGSVALSSFVCTLAFTSFYQLLRRKLPARLLRLRMVIIFLY